MLDVSVSSAKHVGEYKLEITFSNDSKSVVDFSSFIFADHHPDYDKYKNLKYFLDFSVIDGNLNWHDYTMIFPVEHLY